MSRGLIFRASGGIYSGGFIIVIHGICIWLKNVMQTIFLHIQSGYRKIYVSSLSQQRFCCKWSTGRKWMISNDLCIPMTNLYFTYKTYWSYQMHILVHVGRFTQIHSHFLKSLGASVSLLASCIYVALSPSTRLPPSPNHNEITPMGWETSTY